ncbi:hypothetical protein DYB28_002343 [Aphanomyces astaci]|uniref:Uncharacterized protein n=1 Tax=Aphanomyces astaci TaxID=112090 RepID=A0A9X8DIR1_APHAT|nr:hypothetical protein DYB28_002343 [Aphanomyces astaci]
MEELKLLKEEQIVINNEVYRLKGEKRMWKKENETLHEVKIKMIKRMKTRGVDPTSTVLFEWGELPADGPAKRKIERSDAEKKETTDQVLKKMRTMLEEGNDKPAWETYPRTYLQWGEKLKSLLTQKKPEGQRVHPHIWVYGFPGINPLKYFFPFAPEGEPQALSWHRHRCCRNFMGFAHFGKTRKPQLAATKDIGELFDYPDLPLRAQIPEAKNSDARNATQEITDLLIHWNDHIEELIEGVLARNIQVYHKARKIKAEARVDRSSK